MYSNVGANLARYVQMSEQMENNALERQLKQMQIDNILKENEAWEMAGGILGEGPGEKTFEAQNPNFVDPASMPGYEGGSADDNRPLTGDYYKQTIQQTRKETRPEMYQRAVDAMMKKSPRTALSMAKSISDMEKKDTDVQIVTNPVDGTISMINKRTGQIQHLTDGMPKTEIALYQRAMAGDKIAQQVIDAMQRNKEKLKQTPTINIRQGGGTGQPKIGSIWERIQAKLADGQQLTAGEQKIYEIKTSAPRFDLQLRRQAQKIAQNRMFMGDNPEDKNKTAQEIEDEEYEKLLKSGGDYLKRTTGPTGPAGGKGRKPLDSFFK